MWLVREQVGQFEEKNQISVEPGEGKRRRTKWERVSSRTRENALHEVRGEGEETNLYRS